MSAFSGVQGKGAMKRRKDEKYAEAVARQSELIEKGTYIDRTVFNAAGVIKFPAPIEKFLRVGDKVKDGKPYTPTYDPDTLKEV